MNLGTLGSFLMWVGGIGIVGVFAVSWIWKR